MKVQPRMDRIKERVKWAAKNHLGELILTAAVFAMLPFTVAEINRKQKNGQNLAVHHFHHTVFREDDPVRHKFQTPERWDHVYKL